MLENRQVIAVDQDPLGIQGTVVEQEGSGQVWSKPLDRRRAAVALLNRGAQPLQITTTAQHGRAAVGRELHGARSVGRARPTRTTGAISALVPPDSVVLYRVTPRSAG